MLFSFSCLLALAACTKTESQEEPLASFGDAVWLDAEAGATVSQTYSFSASWAIRNNCSWLTVRPLSGFAGENELTFTADTGNTQVTENQGYIDITVDTETYRLYVFQRGVSGFEVSTEQVTAKGSAGESTFTVIANEEFAVAASASWVAVTVSEEGEAILLDDGVSESEARSYTVTLSLSANDTGDTRSAELTVSSASSTATLNLKQFADLSTVEADYYSDFYRYSLGMRFTATWCGYCPMMAESFKQAQANSDRFIPFTVHASSSSIYSEGATALANTYGITGYPMGIVNSYALVENYQPAVASNIIVNLANEAAQQLPSKTGIMAQASYEDDVVDLDVYVAAKESGEYALHAYILENDIVAYQTSYLTDYPGGSNYVHDFVVRCAITGTSGQSFTATANEVSEFTFNYTVPSGVVEDMSNTYIVLFVTYATNSGFSGSVQYAVYGNYGLILDNAAEVSFDEPTFYTYE